MKKKFLITLLILLIFISNISFASFSTVTMSVADNSICSIDIGENFKFEKSMISKDLNNKEVTMQLQICNNGVLNKPTGELILVLDNSKSMENTISGTATSRKDLIINSANTLVTNLLKDNTQLKIGVVSFSTNTDVSKEGTLEDANIVSSLSSDTSSILSNISSIDANGPRTNLEAGITLAANSFSSEKNNKYLIILTDGVPNVAINYDKTYYSDDVINKTKAKLSSIANTGVSVFSMLSGITDTSYIPETTTKSFGEIIAEIFGSESTPTAGKFYYIQDSEIEKTITDSIYNNLLPSSTSLNNFKIVDYFPQKIIDNFDFSYVSSPNIGDISASINTSDNSITWTIPKLDFGQTATVQYKLKLKQNFNVAILNDIIPTNEKVDISYTDSDGKIQSKSSNVSPKLKLTEPDVTVAPKVIPQTGATTLIIFITVSVLILSFSLIKVLILHNKMKN